VEQISGNVSPATPQETTALHRGVGRHVRRRPMLPSVKCVRHIKMPDPGEISCVGVAVRRCRPIESDRGATGAARNGRWKRDLLQSVNGANIKKVLPGQAAVIRCGNRRGGAVSSAQHIDATTAIDANCWITPDP